MQGNKKGAVLQLMIVLLHSIYSYGIYTAARMITGGDCGTASLAMPIHSLLL